MDRRTFVQTVLASACAAGRDESSGNMVLRGRAGPSDIVITTTPRLAGAVHSLTWNGQEFIDSTDHGRQLQSALNCDAGTPLTNETFNPTEAGSRADGAGASSSSRLLHSIARANYLQTTTQMAFWLRPGEKSGDHAAKNTTVLSDHLLTKRLTIGHRNLPHVIDYRVTFSLPLGEKHTQAVFEAVTGYMPTVFENFRKYEAKTATLGPLSDGPGEQEQPVVLATADGSHAMGVYCPEPEKGFDRVGYGRFRFRAEKVNKWNCVFRRRDEQGISAGEYAFRAFVVVGAQETVRTSLRALHDEFQGR